MSLARTVYCAALYCAALSFGLVVALVARAADEAKPTADAAAPSGYTPATSGNAATPYEAISGGSGTLSVAADRPSPQGKQPDPENADTKPNSPTDSQSSGAGHKTKDGKDGKDDEVKTIHRPVALPISPNPAEFKNRPDGDGKIRLNFHSQPWEPVLEWLAKISGKSLDWQDLPGDSLNLTTQRSYLVAEVRDLINRHLLSRGFTLLCHGEVMTVVDVKKLDPSMVPRVSPADLATRDAHEYVKVAFPLDAIPAESAVAEFKPLLSPNGRITPLMETNRLEAMDAVANLRDIDTVLREQRSDDGQPRPFREFRLKYARAEDVHDLLCTLFGIEVKPRRGGDAAGGMTPEQQAMMAARMQERDGREQQAMPPTPKNVPINFAINNRSNSLLVRARPDKMSIVAQVIEALDVPVDRNGSILQNMNRMTVYRLSGIDPEPVVKTLMDVGNLDPTTRIDVDKKNSALIVYASLADHVTIRALVDKLNGSERKFEVIRLHRLAADYVAGTIEFMLGSAVKKEKRSSNPWSRMGEAEPAAEKTPRDFHVDADVEQNRLLLWATPVELAEIQTLLVKLGEIPAVGSGADKVRVIDAGDAKETQEFIEKIHRLWPSAAGNSPQAAPPPIPPPQIPNSRNFKSQIPPADHSTEHLPRPRIRLTDLGANSLFAESPQNNGVPYSPVQNPPAQSPPVEISVGPDGKLIVTSDDPQALDQIEQMASESTGARKDYHVFHLKFALAGVVTLNLQDFFREDKKEARVPSRMFFYDYGAGSNDNSADERRLSKRRPLKFVPDPDSNTILVAGADSKQLRTIEELIKVYDQMPPTDSQSVRRTDIIHLEHSKAKAVADTVKDVYRDLLSANDKALVNEKQKETVRSFIFDYDDSDNKEPKTPKFKGLLSIGVDEVSNSLMVSAPAYLFEHVARMIKQLDDAAAPTYTIRVVRAPTGVPIAKLKEALDAVYNQKHDEKPPAEKQPAKTAPAGAAKKKGQTNNKSQSDGEKHEENDR